MGKIIADNCISINRVNNTQMRLSTPNDFFANEVVVTWRQNALVIRLAGLDDVKTQKATLIRKNYVLLVYGQCECGVFNFDEDESNEDQKIIYFK
jgi:hypothetical protein